MTEVPGMQQWNKGQKHKTAAMSEERERTSLRIFRKTIELELKE
jgi:hypothetical protein